MEKLNITSDVLDKLGFTEYWDENCSSGTRTLIFSDNAWFRIVEVNETDDESEGYGDPRYVANYFYFCGSFSVPKKDKNYDLFFLHEMWECIATEFPDYLTEFATKCREANMGYYIDEYLKR